MWRQKAPGGKHDGGCESIVFFRTDTPIIRSHTDDTRVHTDRHASATINVSSSPSLPSMPHARSPPRHLLSFSPSPLRAHFLRGHRSWIPRGIEMIPWISLRRIEEAFQSVRKIFFPSRRGGEGGDVQDCWLKSWLVKLVSRRIRNLGIRIKNSYA